MAKSRGHGDEREVTKRDGPAGAGSDANPRFADGRRASGHQSGSTRPAVRTGVAKKAPKKADVPPKGTAREAAPKKMPPRG